MNAVEQNLAIWKESLIASLPIGGLLSRNPVVYKWKAPFRAWMLREALFWRLNDLMAQSYLLYQQEHVLGARILLRSGFESVAVLIFLNQLLRGVIEDRLDFHEFGQKTSQLLFGSRDGSTNHNSINILTILQKSEKEYSGIVNIYASLSESAHPNYEGMVVGYSKLNRSEYDTYFSNRWANLYGADHLELMELCMGIFHNEYNNVWPVLIDKLEFWIEINDSELEKIKGAPPSAI